ncbi:hypothetical protein [Amycolatopsis pigmentata]|uniref:Uncharacterized protein n=1 Tax=Amycolatopsis pigmentata TaxID=450801 RepID=A0ABW5G096_9PSEU
MTKIATHPDPVCRPVPSFMLRGVLDDIGRESDNFEQLWARRVGEDRFELGCIPFKWFDPGYVAVSVEAGRSHDEFFAALAELGDIVEVERIPL